MQPIERGRKLRVCRRELSVKARGLGVSVDRSVERSFPRGVAAKAHKGKIHSDAMKPSGKSRIAAERADFAQHEDERFLSEVFGGGDVTYDAQAHGKHARAVSVVNALEGRSVAALRAFNHLSFGERRVRAVA